MFAAATPIFFSAAWIMVTASSWKASVYLGPPPRPTTMTRWLCSAPAAHGHAARRRVAPRRTRRTRALTARPRDLRYTHSAERRATMAR
jgi:hypothetical protein